MIDGRDAFADQIQALLSEHEATGISQMLEDVRAGRITASEQGHKLLADLEDAADHYRRQTARIEREIQATHAQRKEILSMQEQEMDADAKNLRQLLDEAYPAALADARREVKDLKRQVQEAKLQEITEKTLKHVMTPEEFERQLILELFRLFGFTPQVVMQSNMSRDALWEAVAIQNGITRVKHESIFVKFPRLKRHLAPVDPNKSDIVEPELVNIVDPEPVNTLDPHETD